MNQMAPNTLNGNPVSSVQAKPGAVAGTDADWWRGAVIYQIYPRSFQDSNGDGIGDLPGITSRLGYAADLGVDAIWISPFFTSPMKDFGYDVSNYRDVDPIFGTLADFDALVEEAHRLGLKVMIDQVLSHTSDKHHWFVESRASRDNPKADWYVWADAKPDGSPPNNWLSIFGGSAWEWDSARLQYYLHNFLTCQPDLNFHNEDVQNALLDDVRFWLDRGVDGFRLDTVNFYMHSEGLEDNPALPDEERDFTTAPAVNPYNYQSHKYDKSQQENVDFLKRFRALLDEYPGSTSVGEIGDGERQVEIMAEYTAGNDRIHMAYTFDFLSSAFSKEHFLDRIDHYGEHVSEGWPCWAFSNHDVVRHASRWADELGLDHISRKRLPKLTAALLLALRGSVCLYQGEELGLPEADLDFEDLVDPYGIRFWPAFKGRDGCRTPMPWQSGAGQCGFTTGKPWLPLDRDHTSYALDIQQEDPESVLNHYKRLLAFRRQHSALRTGKIELLDHAIPGHPEMVMAFTRTANEKILCVFNFSTDAVEWTLPEGMSVTPCEELGFKSQCDNKTVRLEGFEAFFGLIE